MRASLHTAEWREQSSQIAGDLAWETCRLVLADPGMAAREAARILGVGSQGAPERIAFDLTERLRGRTLLDRLGAPGSTVPPTSLDRLQQEVLGPGELLVTLLAHGDTTLAFMASRDSLKLATVILPGDPLNGRIAELHRLLSGDPFAAAGQPRGVADSALATLARGPLADLLAPWARHRQVLIVPDGGLRLLPWSMVVQAAQPDVTPGGLPITSVIPAASVLATLRSRPAGAAGETPILAIAGPDSSGSRRPLPGAQREVGWLARQFRNVTAVDLTRKRSTPDWSGFGVLHLAVHSLADDEAPWQSSMLLDRDEDRAEDGYVTAEQVAGMQLGARMAVLSSCQTAASAELSGEGVVGLSTAFLAAGVPSVVATQWPVDDRATARIMEAFYEELSSGRPVGEALARAQARLAASPATRDPFYWAGFVVVGDPGVTVRLAERPWLARWGGAVVIVVITAFVFALLAWSRRRRRRVET